MRAGFLLACLLAAAQAGSASGSPATDSTASGGSVTGSQASGGPAAGGKVLAALCYHRFGPETRLDPYRISLQRLSGQLDWLRARGWQGVSLTQVAAALDGDASSLPEKGVLLSVDDGYKAGALGAPVFERHGYRAVYFVYPGVITRERAPGEGPGRGAFLTWGDLRALEARGHWVASHTLTHPNLAKVGRGLSPKAYARWVRRELWESKRLLEGNLEHPVEALAWPYGAYNPALVAEARRAGYRQLWSVSGGVNLADSLDRTRLRRILLMGRPTLESFAERLERAPLAADVQGLGEGGLVYRSQLPLQVVVDGVASANLGGQELRPEPAADGDADAGATRFTLPEGLKTGFHFITIEDPGHRATPYLFQVAPDAWRPYFQALDQGPDASESPSQAHGAP